MVKRSVPDAWLRDTPLVVLSAAPAVVPAELGYLPAAANDRGKDSSWCLVPTSIGFFLHAAGVIVKKIYRRKGR